MGTTSLLWSKGCTRCAQRFENSFQHSWEISGICSHCSESLYNHCLTLSLWSNNFETSISSPYSWLRLSVSPLQSCEEGLRDRQKKPNSWNGLLLLINWYRFKIVNLTVLSVTDILRGFSFTFTYAIGPSGKVPRQTRERHYHASWDRWVEMRRSVDKWHRTVQILELASTLTGNCFLLLTPNVCAVSDKLVSSCDTQYAFILYKINLSKLLLSLKYLHLSNPYSLSLQSYICEVFQHYAPFSELLDDCSLM